AKRAGPGVGRRRYGVRVRRSSGGNQDEGEKQALKSHGNLLLEFGRTERDGYGRPKVFERKTAICPRVTGLVGQYTSKPQPAVVPRSTSSSTHGAKGLEHGTSSKVAVVHGGGR